MLGRVIGRTAVVFGFAGAWTEDDWRVHAPNAAADVTSRQGLLEQFLDGALMPTVLVRVYVTKPTQVL